MYSFLFTSPAALEEFNSSRREANASGIEEVCK
jgi:hypothetical protein